MAKEVFLKAISNKQHQNDEDNPRTIIKSAIKFASGTFLSRIGGLVRDMSMAFCFGTDPAIAAFLVAFRFANLLRRIFGEGALLNSFIPHFESYREINPKHAAQFFRDTFFSLMLLLVILIGLVELALFFWLTFGDISTSNQDIVSLTMIMLPGLLFICLFSICSGLLQCEKSFFLTGVAPLIFNAIWIGSIWVFKNNNHQKAVIYLSVSVTFAFLFQWLITFPKTLIFLRRYLSWKELFQGSFFSNKIRCMISSMSMVVIGVGATQINSAIDAVFARYVSLEGPAYLNYAIHVQQLPLALFGIGISTALLPSLSRAIQDFNQYSRLLHFSISNAIFFLAPCCIAILVLGCSGINLIYGRGDFNNESIIQTTFCLWGYGLGLIPMGINLLLALAFYAKKDYWIPTITSIISLFVNIILNLLFVFIFQYGAASLAISTSLAACFNTGFLFRRLSKEIGISLFVPIISSSFKIVILSIISGIVTLFVEYMVFNEPSILILFGKIKMQFTRNFTEQVIVFFILSGSFILSFVSLAWILSMKEILNIFDMTSKKISSVVK